MKETLKEKPTPPCLGCEFRRAKCQCDCVPWKEYVIERDAVYEENRKKQILVAGYAEHMHRNMDRAARHKRRHKK